MSGPDFPEWQRLADVLSALSTECGATNGYVLDAWANLWCAGNDLHSGGESDRVMSLAQRELATLPVALNRGGKLDRAHGETYFRSFAGIYVLVLRFNDDAIDAAQVRAAVAKALPAVEALTLLLPPPDGPTSGGVAGAGVA